MKTLAQLYEEHHGKVSDKWSSYLTEYDRLLSSHRDRPVNILEIGIQNGGSLEVWGRFFANAQKLIGCDINPACANLEYTDPRITVVIGNANLDETEHVIATHTERFDVVIDDGSHTSRDIVKAFLRYFPHINEGGIFIAEDLHCSYWAEYGGGLYDPYSSIAFFKQLIDVVNYEHWGIKKHATDLLEGFGDKYECRPSDDVLATIHSVEFVNSICIVRKAKADKNVLGHRVVVGEIASVVDDMIALGAQPGAAIAPPQHGNVWSTLVRSPAEFWEGQLRQFADLQQGVASRDEHIAAAQREAAYQQGQITELRLMAERYEQRIQMMHEKAMWQSNELTKLQTMEQELNGRLEQLRLEIADRDAQVVTLGNNVHDLVNSTSTSSQGI